MSCDDKHPRGMENFNNTDFSEASTTFGMAGGYVTAVEDSQISLYYSVNESLDKTLEPANSSSSQNLDDTINCDNFIQNLQNSQSPITAAVMKLETSATKMTSSTPKFRGDHLKTPKRDENFDRFVNIIKSVEAKNKENVIFQNVLMNSNLQNTPRRTMNINKTPTKFQSPTTLECVKAQLTPNNGKKEDNTTVAVGAKKNLKRITFGPSIMINQVKPGSQSIEHKEVTEIKKTGQSMHRRSLAPRASFISSPLKVVLPTGKTLISSSILTRSKHPNFKQSTGEKNNEAQSPTMVTLQTEPHPPKQPNNRKSMSHTVIAKNRFPLRKSIIPSNKVCSIPMASSSSTVLQQLKTTTKPRQTMFKLTVEAPKSTSFDCDVCKKQFRLESTLIHHKKSHDAPVNKCRYCDKKFDLALALKNHVLNNCTKIQFNEKCRILAEQTANISTKKQADNAAIASSNSSIADLVSATMNRNLHAGVYSVPKKVLKCEKCDKMFFNMFSLQDHKKEKKCFTGSKKM